MNYFTNDFHATSPCIDNVNQCLMLFPMKNEDKKDEKSTNDFSFSVIKPDEKERKIPQLNNFFDSEMNKNGSCSKVDQETRQDSTDPGKLPTDRKRKSSETCTCGRSGITLFGVYCESPNFEDCFTKKLTKSDVDGSSRLLLGKELVKKHVLPEIMKYNIPFDERIGIDISVRDVDTRTDHTLKLKKWITNSFVLQNKWKSNFVDRKRLNENDEIGLKWDDNSFVLQLKVLRRN